MSGDKDTKTANVKLINDFIFIFFFFGGLLIAIFGERGMTGLAKILGLGQGWPELLQGSFGFLFLILGAVRALQVTKRARQ